MSLKQGRHFVDPGGLPRPRQFPEAQSRVDLKQEGQLAWFHPLVPAIGFVLLVGMTWLYATGSDFYFRILKVWMLTPYEYPFLDLAAMPGWVACWQTHGFDVYTSASWTSCGLAPIIYSPLWLRLSFLPTDPIWTNWLGLSVLSVFLLSLGLLPGSRRLGDRILVVLATFSSLPAFAMERGNMDLVMFLLAVGAALCLGGKFGSRILGYSLIVLGGLLKFYPLVSLVLLVRERLTVFLALGIATIAILAGTAVTFLDELRRLTPVPGGKPFTDMWGARNLPTGIPTVLEAFFRTTGLHGTTVPMLFGHPFVPMIVASLLVASALVLASRLAGRTNLRDCLAEIPGPTLRFLLIGGMLVIGCFFAGQNVGYRGVLLLLILPGILALTHPSASRALRSIFALTAGATLCVLWELTTRFLATELFGGQFYPVGGALPILIVWLVQELAWWWLITVLMAIVIRFVLDSPASHDLRFMLAVLARRTGWRGHWPLVPWKRTDDEYHPRFAHEMTRSPDDR